MKILLVVATEQITYNVNKKGPKSSIQFNLQGLDAINVLFS